MNEPIQPHPKNVDGPFYVELGCCTSCDVPMQEAPGHFAYDHDHHCSVCRQPQSASEITDMIGTAWMAELQCVRYRGRDNEILRRLAELDLRHICESRKLNMIRLMFGFLAVCLLATPLMHAADKLATDKTVKVFVLAGQSNMEGKARNALLDYQATNAKTQELFSHLRRDDKWVIRDDVFIKFLDRKGPLTIGYGSPDCTGVELEFGTAMGNHFDQPVLLIKTAWGGHSLYKLFRSPSAGLPAKMLPELAERTGMGSYWQ